ncbi:MAG: T9SS type A sorting domain-containing protein [Flavobacteriales bacterium]|nr:T9SS type A sorting domain-containing protein [Flavobacteriales bacterium]
MNRSGRLSSTLLGLLLLGAAPSAMAQGDCQNTAQYPGNSIIPDAGGLVTTISTCSFEAEYSVVTAIEAGATYRFRLESGGYITVREGTFNGPVVGQGYSIVDVTPTGTVDLFAHWTIDDACTTQTNCVVTSVQYFGTCAPPLAFATLVEDCDLGTYTVQVDVVSLGSGTSVNITTDVFGDIQTITGVGLGVTEVGPYFFGEQVLITVEHETDPACNQDLGMFQETGECPVYIFCGQPAQNFAYCYSNDETKVWNYTSLGGSGTLLLTFISGNVQSSFYDVFTIYDGTDNTGAILYQNSTATSVNLAGLMVSSTSGSFHLELVTDGFTSCGDAGQTEWNWQVRCLNCQMPSATATNVDDCVNNEFSVPVSVTSTGDGATVTIVYTVNGGLPQSLTGIGIGETVLGPFVINDVIVVYLHHESDPDCVVPLGTYTDSGDCPNLIVCGTPPLVENYCYVASDLHNWSYQSIGSGTLRMTFHHGTIESNTYDHLRIYDGVDATGTLLFDHTTFLSYNLGPVGSNIVANTFPFYGLQFYSTTGTFYMEMSSDGSVQCGEPFPATNFDSWEWDVVCLDCTIPEGTVTIVDDCANDEFSLDVDITSTGDGTTASIDYTVNAGPVQNLAGLPLGITTLGPFPFGDIVNVTLAHESNSLCNIPKGDFTDTGTCPELITCGTPINQNYCYANNNDVRWYYQGTGTFPLGIFFNSGTVFAGDLVQVYDGGDINAPLLYSGNGTVTNVTGLFFYTTNVDHRMTVRILADGFTDCATSATQDPVDWTVDCLDCVPPTATFSIVQDCENFQYFVDVVVTDLGSDPDPVISNTAGLPSDTITAIGTYQVGPFTSGTQVVITIENDANSLCNIYSGTMVNPLCPTVLCGGTPLAQTYCYTNLENTAWAYATPDGSGTINLSFIRGTIESNAWDDLIIYDGPDATGTILFNHGATTSNLGPAGSAVNGTAWIYEPVNVTTTGPNIYMTLTTDASGACNTNGTPNTSYDPWEFNVLCVGCSTPGVSYNLISDCLHRNYRTEVIVTAPPGADGMTIENMITGQSMTVTAAGVYEFGPYFHDSLSIFGVTDLASPGCTWLSDSLTFPSDSCIIRSCGFDNYEYCYENAEDRWYTYQSLQPVPTTIAFLWGQMLTGDRIVVYNGRNENSTVIYQGSNGGNLSGFAVNSQNTEHIITLRIQSNATGSCDDGQATVPLRWTVGCGAVGIDDVSPTGFSVFPNPTEGVLYISVGSEVTGNARVRVLDMSGRQVFDEPMNLRASNTSSIDMRGLQSGQYLIQLVTDQWTKVQRVQVAR